MAKLFPNKLSGSVPPVIARTYRLLKKLPDTFSVWYNISETQTSPHILIVWKDSCAYLLHITSTDQQLVERAIHGDLLKNDRIPLSSLGDKERAILATFTQNLTDTTNFPIKSIILFPNVNTGTLDTLSVEQSQNNDVSYLGKQQLTADKLAEFLIKHAPEELNNPQLIQLRHKFSPEVNIPRNFTPLEVTRDTQEATLTPQLLDLDQEWCVKNNLYLPEASQNLVDANISTDSESSTSQLVTGVAGSGKSLILLYRALLNAKLNPNAEVLILTHNRPINNELQARFNQLTDGKHNVTWLTFFGWARQQLNNNEWSERVINPNSSLNIIEKIIRTRVNNTFTSSFLLDEIGFIKDHNIRRIDDYLSTSRTGQGIALQANQRRSVWNIFKQYQEHLRDNQLTDWHTVAIRFHDKAMQGKCRFPKYNCILIDEAQFFAKTWFDIIKKALIPGGQLFLSADPTQGFLKRRQSWISSGIEVRGRTTKLQTAYRNSQEILRFATNFFLQREGSTDGLNDDESLNLLSNDQIDQAQLMGFDPAIIPTKNEQETTQKLIAELDALAKKIAPNTAPSILILHANSEMLESTLKSISSALPTLNFNDTKLGPPPTNTFAQFSTLNAATGLEASIVFLLGIDSLLDKELSPQLTEDERTERITQNTKQLYMGFTRAAQKLVLFSSNFPNLNNLNKKATC